MTDKQLYDFVELMLEEESFEELLERFDLTPAEVFEQLFSSGKIDPVLVCELGGFSEEDL